VPRGGRDGGARARAAGAGWPVAAVGREGRQRRRRDRRRAARGPGACPQHGYCGDGGGWMSTTATDTRALDELSINTIRTLSMDAVQRANSGHPGAPMGLAPLAYVLYTRVMRHNPGNAD